MATVEQERKATGESRSEFFRRAAETLFRLRLEKETMERYTRAYELKPEIEDEVAAARRAAPSILAWEPWE